MTTVITGHDLTRDVVLRVARDGQRVAIDPAALDRMAAARAIVEERLAAGDAIYGGSTGLGVLKRAGLAPDAAGSFSTRVIRQHLVAQGEHAPADVVRATMLRLANGFASGFPGVRPVLAERLADALNDGTTPRIRMLGSVGQSDLGQMADLAIGLFDGVALEAGEGLALVSSNSFSTAAAALAVADAAHLIASMEVAGAMSFEGLAGNPAVYDRAIADTRRYPGLRGSLDHIGSLLERSAIHIPGAARSLQDPLTFRNLPQIMGACRDALAHVDSQLEIELNASQGNPIVLVEERRVVSAANFEILPLAAALDYLRIVLASALGTSAERSVKLLETPWSGLPTGLATSADPTDPGLSYLGIVAQSIAGEARLLAAPVSFELVSTAHAEGIEDRTSLAPLSARRLAGMADLGAAVVAIELAVATQAIELRSPASRGVGTAEAAAIVRRHVPSLAPDATVPDLEGLTVAVRSGAFADIAGDDRRAADGSRRVADASDGSPWTPAR
jgi:histidine ammonia-lyase